MRDSVGDRDKIVGLGLGLTQFFFGKKIMLYISVCLSLWCIADSGRISYPFGLKIFVLTRQASPVCVPEIQNDSFKSEF